MVRFVNSCIELYTAASDPEPILSLLWILFRGIGGGKFETLYRELFSTIQVLIPSLLDLAKKTSLRCRNLCVELSLIVPARLSTLLPFMHYLVQIVSLALSGSSESLMKLGLRTLDFWLDSLSLEFLLPILRPHSANILQALFRRMNSSANDPLAMLSVRVIGKLGGFNRENLFELSTFGYSQDGDGISVSFHFREELELDPIDFPLDRVLATLTRIARREKVSDKILVSSLRLYQCIISLLIPKDSEIVSNPFLTSKSIETQSTQGENEFQMIRRRAEKSSFQRVFCNVVRNCILLCTFPATETESRQFLSGLIKLYVFSALSSAQDDDCKFMGDKIIPSAISSTLCSESSEERKVAEDLLIEFLSVLNSLGRPDLFLTPVMRVFVEEFVHKCHCRTENERYAGACGIFHIILRSPAQAIRSWQGDLVRAILLISDEAQWETSSSGKYSKRVMDILIRMSVGAPQTDPYFATVSGLKSDSESAIQVDEFLLVLIQNLAHPISGVRSFASESIGALSKLNCASLPSILSKCSDRVLSPLFSSGFAALPIASRIGYISALTTFLKYGDAVIPISQLIMKLAADAIGDMIEVEPRSASLSGEKKDAMAVKLYVENLKFVSALLHSNSLLQREQDWEKLREEFVKGLFKSFSRPEEEIIEQAKICLERQPRPLPKELLRECLRPYLTSLGDQRRLTLPVLKQLSTLLGLLNKYFNQALGDRLLQHFESFVDTLLKSLEEQCPLGSGSELDTKTTVIRFNEHVRILLAVVDLFHLLPSVSDFIIPKLVHGVVSLETSRFDLASYSCSLSGGTENPFRISLFKFLSKQPTDSLKLFLSPASLGNVHLSKLFMAFLDSPMGQGAALYLVENPALIINACFDVTLSHADFHGQTSEELKAELELQGVKIIHILSRFGVKTIVSGRNIIAKLLSVYEFRFASGSSSLHEETMSLELIDERLILIKLFLIYLEQNSPEISVMWSCLHCLTLSSVTCFAFVDTFLRSLPEKLSFENLVLGLNAIRDKFSDVSSCYCSPHLRSA
jgi:transformation/transcription domain-associated protein